jgi:hypothetical protein
MQVSKSIPVFLDANRAGLSGKTVSVSRENGVGFQRKRCRFQEIPAPGSRKIDVGFKKNRSLL